MSNTNPQGSIPFNNGGGNSNTHMNNMPPMGTQPSFMNFPNQQQQLLPLQTNHTGMPQFGPMVAMYHQGQYPTTMGFAPQNTVQNNMNNVSAFQMQRPFFNMMASNANHVNPSQPPGQFFMQNPANVPQQFNHNVGVPYGQFPMHAQVQNMNQYNPMQMMNAAQVGPYYVPSCSVPMMVGCPNQMSQGIGPMNHAFMPNFQLGMVHSSDVGQHGNPNLQKAVNPSMNVNAPLQAPIPTQQTQGNLSASFNHHSVQTPQTKNNLQHMRSQGNHVEDGGNDFSKSNGNKFKKQNFNRNVKSEKPHCRFQQSQFHHMKNAKRQGAGFGINGGKGFSNDRSGIHGQATNHVRVQEKRSISLNYTEQEVQQWREERRKSYPSKANINKKLTEKLTKAEVIDRDARLRRMQLREILAKQAELGVEVAEIPPHYLSDSENQLQGRIDNRNAPNMRERFQNKRNRRGRYDQRDRFTKKQKWEKSDSSNMPSLNIQKTTLLQKLLSADIRRDKIRLLQVFRFMVMNSFFKDSPEKPLTFPLVLLKNSEWEDFDETLVDEFDNEKDGDDSCFVNDEKEGDDSCFVNDKKEGDDSYFVNEKKEGDDNCTVNDKKDAQVEEKAYSVDENCINEENKSSEEDEEEGEIID